MIEEKKAISIPIEGGIRVVVPMSLQDMTTYVLKEQHDWFEDEIKFIRRLIKKGGKVIDIGANYGTYTLSFASLVGESGEVWSFEPASKTFSFLEQSVMLNRLNNVTLIQKGLSNSVSRSRLFLSTNCELNTLLPTEDNSSTNYEEVDITTLDVEMKNFNWSDIDFIKMDAEGAEEFILDGGDDFFTKESPLIMYELKHGEELNRPLVSKFESMGFANYRLVPKLDILVPFDMNAPFDGYLLNLFACKPDRAEKLKEEGYLVDTTPLDVELEIDHQKITQYLETIPFLKDNSTLASPEGEYALVFNNYVMSSICSDTPSLRVAYLMKALSHIKNFIQGPANIESLSTCARVAFEAGERQLGVEIVFAIIHQDQKERFKIKYLFFPVFSRYDTVSQEKKPEAWLLASFYEAYIEKHASSTYFSKEQSIPIFELLEKTGFMSLKIKDRWDFVSKVYNQPPATNRVEDKIEPKKSSKISPFFQALSKEILQSHPNFGFSILEVGARPLDGEGEAFHKLLDIFPNSTISAIEVDEELCKELNKTTPKGMHFYPEPLGLKDEEHDFYETNHPMCDSLYKPNEKLLSKYVGLDVSMIKSKTTVKTISLDQFTQKHNIDRVDFIKIDIQGAELDVFKGGVKTLEDIVAIVSEVEFIPLYIDQPLFGDVSAFLLNQGLMFHKFLGTGGRTLKPYVLDENVNSMSQMMWSDALFIQDIRFWTYQSSEKLIKIGVLALLYNSLDVALAAFRICDQKDGTKLVSVVSRFLSDEINVSILPEDKR